MFFASSSSKVKVFGNLTTKDVKEIKGLVQRQMRRSRLEHVWDMLWGGDFKAIPQRFRLDGVLEIERVEACPNGKVLVSVSMPPWIDAGYTYALNRTNGWRIVERREHWP
ncbi:hypothetical protein [Pedosphaera parvula]|uniref:Uncharacterized protein n=1 Tax=Pedosphaera parvula (strain Ellin514) TaxID=320771 RepID=B9XCP5_PEDPL|nr:hypothetical protein [Pedosphaera parvula]EEF62241.1 hypothetical protein Cflav_PD4876 [Pedosphaera parvula Ellin514]